MAWPWPGGERTDLRVIVWLNGTFGVGKTTTAMRLSSMLENARLFDPEMVGYLLMEALKDHEFSDFQELPPGGRWRALVPAVTRGRGVYR